MHRELRACVAWSVMAFTGIARAEEPPMPAVTLPTGASDVPVVSPSALGGRIRRAEEAHDDVPHDIAPPSSAPFQQLRYLEDYSRLGRDPSRSREPLDIVKYVPLGGGAWLSLGGQHRLRYEYTSPSAFGTTSDQSRESVMLTRNLLHADVHALPALRLFAQVGSYYAIGAPARGVPPGTNQLDVAQLFVESGGDVAGVSVIARVGRQEMGLGSTRWISVRDATNMRRAFDLARVSLAGEAFDSHTFFGFSPDVMRGVFDDLPDRKALFWGTYWTVALAPEAALSTDLFYLAKARQGVTYREVSGDEVRHTLGTRVFGKLPFGLDYIGHGLVQTGKLADANVLAWGVAGALWQRLPGGVARLGVRGDALSGDGKAGDSRVGTFDPLFPNQTFFGGLPLIYPSNLYDVHPLAHVDYESVSFEAGWVFFWRQSVEDAVYRSPGPPMIRPPASHARYTGSQATLTLGHRVSRHVSFDAEYSHVFGGDAFSQSGGHDIDYFATWTTFTY